jgi:hypothetical protein
MHRDEDFIVERGFFIENKRNLTMVYKSAIGQCSVSGFVNSVAYIGPAYPNKHVAMEKR